jgi:hypothetical protein
LPNAYLAITGGLLLDAIAQALLSITSLYHFSLSLLLSLLRAEAMIAVFNEPPVENQFNCQEIASKLFYFSMLIYSRT